MEEMIKERVAHRERNNRQAGAHLLRDRLRKRVSKAYELRSRKDVRELAGCFGTLLVGGEEDRQKVGLGLHRLP